MCQLKEKKHLSARGMLEEVRNIFKMIREPISGNQGKRRRVSIDDCCMSALAMFKLKFPSMLQFDEGRGDKIITQNIKSLFRVDKVPCDTYMRERLDVIDPRDIRRAFTAIFALLQRGRALENYAFLDGKYLLLNDGTGYFSSPTVHCENCCKRRHRDGSVTYYHQFLGAVIAHPDRKGVIPICPEPIMKEDGATKNDCERNAKKRLLKDFRREHPHLQVVLVEDALSANGPHLELLKELNMSFITVVKPKGNPTLFDWIEGSGTSHGKYHFKCKEGKEHKFKFINGIPLNDAHPELLVNFLEYWSTDKKCNVYHNTWVTDLEISKENAYAIARGGRTRWHIENETFNTLKNQGYHFEHNFGHGNKNLSTVLAKLMMLAFLIDEAERICCNLFQWALKARRSTKKYLWDRIRSFFLSYIIPSWEVLYKAIIAGNERKNVPILDSS